MDFARSSAFWMALVVLCHACHAQTTPVKLSYVKAAAAVMRNDVFSWWLKHGPDSTGGGFYGTLDLKGVSVEPKSKGLIQEGRHLYAMVMYWQYYGQKDARVKTAIDSLYKLLTTKFLDKSDNRFYYSISADGKVLDNTKKLDANLYAIMALARMGRVMGVPAASKLAAASFSSWDATNHDAVRKGWMMAKVKSQDLSVHSLEAIVELWLGDKGSKVYSARLTEAITVMVDKVLLSSGKGYSRKTYNASWKPTDTANTEFGHEMVCTWMLLNLEGPLVKNKVISASYAKKLRSRAIATAKYTLVKGWDAANGGFWSVGDASGKVESKQKIWWQQAEGMLATYKLYQVTKKPAYLDKAYQTAKWVMDYQRDKVNGEWYWGVNAVSKQPGQEWPYMWKGLEWKASYHTGRATVFLSRWTSNQSAV